MGRSRAATVRRAPHRRAVRAIRAAPAYRGMRPVPAVRGANTNTATARSDPSRAGLSEPPLAHLQVFLAAVLAEVDVAAVHEAGESPVEGLAERGDGGRLVAMGPTHRFRHHLIDDAELQQILGS